MVYTPSSLRLLLEELKVSPRKSLSQNFLIDLNIINKILATADVKEEDLVLEIGPGPGALTELLVRNGASVIAVEKDRVFAKALHRFQSVTVYNEDFLKFDFALLSENMKVISNLPYSLTAPIIARLLPKNHLFSTLTLMVQKEVGLRMIAKCGSPDYSRFSLFCQYYADVSYAFTVSPNCFYPKPKVTSCVIHFKLRKHKDPHPQLFPLIHEAFGQKRKMLRASLGKQYGKPRIENLLVELGHKKTARPQDLTLDDYIFFSEKLASKK